MSFRPIETLHIILFPGVVFHMDSETCDESPLDDGWLPLFASWHMTLHHHGPDQG